MYKPSHSMKKFDVMVADSNGPSRRRARPLGIPRIEQEIGKMSFGDISCLFKFVKDRGQKKPAFPFIKIQMFRVTNTIILDIFV